MYNTDLTFGTYDDHVPVHVTVLNVSPSLPQLRIGPVYPASDYGSDSLRKPYPSTEVGAGLKLYDA